MSAIVQRREKGNRDATTEARGIAHLALVSGPETLVVKIHHWCTKQRRMRAPWACWAD
jgi:hypothetical protein